MKVARGLSQGLTPLILVALVVALGSWALRASTLRKVRAEETLEQQAIATTNARKGPSEVVVEEVGSLEAVSSKPVVVEVTGQIVFLVQNGVRAKKGDIIAELDVPRMVRQLRDQQVRYEGSLNRLKTQERELAARVESARIALEQAQEEQQRFEAEQESELKGKEVQRDFDAELLKLSEERLERQKRLADEGLVPRREVELATADINAKQFNVTRQTKGLETDRARKSAEGLDKQAAVRKAESELERATAAQEDELRKARTDLRIEEQGLDRLRDQLAKSILRAPADGIVVLAEQRSRTERRPVQPGDQVWEGMSVATLPDLDKMRAVLDVPQTEARRLKRKQAAVIRVEALPGVELEGEVTEVAQTASEGNDSMGMGLPAGERTFRTHVLIKDTKGAALRPGMTAAVRIMIEKLSDVVTVPLESVFERDDRKVVYVRRGPRFEEVEVEVGAENVDYVVITKGLKGGEEIALRDIGASGDASTGDLDDSQSALPL